MTKTKGFFLSVAVVLLILVGYNLLIHHTAAKSQRRQMLALLDSIPPKTDFLFLGNSLVAAGCDLTAFASAWPNEKNTPSPINLALGGTSPAEHYLILKRAFRQPLPVKYLIYGFFDDQLNAPVSGKWSELVGNRAFSYYFPDEAAAMYAPGSALQKWQLRILGHIPMVSERSSFWGQVELLRRYFEDIGMPKHKTNRFGRVEDFGALESKDVGSFNQRCNSVVGQQKGFSPPIREIIRLAGEHGAQVILVEMPMPANHRKLFYSSPAWTDMRAYLQSLASQEQAIYLSANDWVQDDGKFEDATHLNEEGAKLFSRQLGATIARLPPHPAER